MANGWYLYGIIEGSEEKRWGPIGLEGQEIRAVPFEKIAAVASPWTRDVVLATSENCLSHERALGELIKTETVLPFEFGTIAPTEESLMKLLRTNYLRLLRSLLKLRGKIEVNVTAAWRDTKSIFQELVKEHPMIAHYRREILAKPFDQTYQDRIKIGQMVAEALEIKKRQEGEKLFKALKKGTSDACQVGRPLVDSAMFTGAFLVKRELYPDFERSLSELGKRYDGRVDFKYTEPLPPYHFVDVKIRM
jgi:hypothetical protein